MAIFTVYFCGTSSSKYDDSNDIYWNGETISTLANNNLGREFSDWIVVDGPGSGNLQADELFTEPGGHYKMTGQLFGFGWHANVIHAVNMMKGEFDWERQKLTEENYNQLKNAGVPIQNVEKSGSWFWRKYDYGSRHVTQQQLQAQIIKQHRKDGIIPTQVNLVGWSRGGVSCIMLANAMLADIALKHIPVNIFAIDPVPGLLNFQKEKTTLGNNVKNYIAFYARDERSFGFSCVIPKIDSSTNVHIYPMAGRHGTLVGNAAADGSSGPKVLIEPGEIVRHYAETCLTNWGVSLDKKLGLTNSQVDQRLSTIKASYDSYTLMRDKVYTIFSDVKGEREIHLNGDNSNFTAAHGTQYTPNKGLSTGHILTSDYFSDIV